MVEVKLIVVAEIHKNLKEFGYEDLTRDTVADEINKLESGVKPTNIIGLMAKDMLVKNGFMED
tara:strand:+ start:222 stop:410 length:189 start_codon:yes stop_codon:yes gene_type:complete